ncbi:uncharacterized protein JCM15063_004926 [Sporobolomyces koalae]|uniref:uncharacterized protein n=1 Tax=Sporobolomyces koalae TaxID=500713 RepID=UPI0031721B83
MSTCATVPASSSVVTAYSTSTVTNQQVSTVPGSTVSSAVLVTSCPAAPTDAASGAAPPSCTTATSYSVTVLPGTTTTVYSTGETVVPVYSTAFVPASTICSATPVNTPTSTSPRATSQGPASQATPTTTVIVSTSVAAVGPSSSTKILTTTSTYIPGQTDIDATSASAVSPAAGVVTATESQKMVLSTSYLTLFFTTTDNSGHAMTYASSVPTLLNVPKSQAATTNKGAIAGGVVGGVAALAFAVLAFLLMKKRGLFRSGDPEIEEDAWAPPAHGDYQSPRSGRNRTVTGGTLVGAIAGNADEKFVDDNDREVDAATLERHQSWYGTGGAGDRAMQDIYREQALYATRPNSPQGHLGAADAIGAAALGYAGVSRSRSDGGFAPQDARSVSNRISTYSGHATSSQGHSQEYATTAYPYHFSSIPDHRLSGLPYYPSYPNAQPEAYRPASPQQRPRSASPTAERALDAPLHARSNTLPNRLSSKGLALPVHLRSESYGPRPTLEAIQGPFGSTSSSSSPSRGDTTESIPTSSTSTQFPTHSESYGSASTVPYSLPQLDRLKLQRPGFERAVSTESFVAPTQWLGATIANADSASESGMESKEDLHEKIFVNPPGSNTTRA